MNSRSKYSDRVMFIDDERDIGNSIIVTLAHGYRFDTTDVEHVRGFDTMREAKKEIKNAKTCSCLSCIYRDKNQNNQRSF